MLEVHERSSCDGERYEITTRDLVDELNAINANPDFIRSLQAGSPNSSGAATNTGLTVVGTTPGSFDAAFVSQVLLRQIDYAMIHTEGREAEPHDVGRVQAHGEQRRQAQPRPG